MPLENSLTELPLSLDLAPFEPQFVVPAAGPAGVQIDACRALPTLRAGARFERHCQAEFEYLAQTSPFELLSLMRGELRFDPVLLAQAAASLALATESQSLIADALSGLLSHPRPFVREDALRGLAPLLNSSRGLRTLVERLADNDTSPAVRETAAELLDWSA